MIKRCWACLMAVLLMIGCASQPQKENPMELARTAFESGDYQRSATLLTPLAKQGDAQAQYSLGYQIFYGLGVKRDRGQGVYWMQQSASQGYAPAREALNRLTNDTRSRI